MAHKEKYISSSVGHMFQHYDRSKEIPDLANPSNSHLNYNLAVQDQPKKQLDFLHQRLSEIHVHNRKDVNVMVDWVVTLPKTLEKSEDEKKFFKETYDFLNERYGKENVISAHVHKDEITPHMHYSFVPVIEDKKRDGYKLSAKEVITRNDLRTFHGDLSKHMEKTFGYDVGILNEATKDGNKSIQELKRQSATERLQEAAEKASKIVSKADKQMEEVNYAVKLVRTEYSAKRAYILKCDKISKISEEIPDYAKVTKGFFDRKEYITVPLEKWKEKQVSEHEKEYLKSATDSLKQDIQEFEKSKSGQYLDELKYENYSLNEQVKKLKSANESLKEKQKSHEMKEKYLEKDSKEKQNKLVDKIKRTLEKIPEESAEKFKKEWNLENQIELERKKERSRGFDR